VTWNQQKDHRVSYIVREDFSVTSHDWIGLYKVTDLITSDCNPVITPNPGIPAIFANPESQD